MKNINNRLLSTDHSRRLFLKGAGVALMLPRFVSLGNNSSQNESNPKRMVFLHVPNGKIMDKWTPKKLGNDYEITQTLKPLENLRNHFQVISGLRHDKAAANGDGAGDHARAQGTFLTGRQVLKSTKSARNGISVDQVASKFHGNKTYLPSLELSTQRGRLSGTCDSGYSCLYQYNLSWENELQPMVPESSPRQALERMFSIWGDEQHTQRNKLLTKNEGSILDFVNESSKDLKKSLAKEDIEKLEQFHDAFRDLEKRAQKDKPVLKLDNIKKNFDKEPASYREKIENLMDVMILGLEMDVMRISTMIIADEGNNRPFPELGISDGHHSLSHHRNNADWIKNIEKIDLFYVQRLAYFLNEMQNKKVNGKSLLDQSMVVYGSAISDGNSHAHFNLPIILAGHGGGTLTPGSHKLYKDQPMCNLFTSMLQKFDCPVKEFGDSTGSLNNL